MNWSDLSIGQFNEIAKLNENKDLDEFDRAVIICSIVFQDKEFSLDMPYKELVEYTSKLAFMKTELKPSKLKSAYKLGDYDIKLNKNVSDISTAQYIDYSNFLKNKEMVKAVSVYLIPSGCTYNKGYDFLDLVEKVNAMPCTDFLAISFFLQERWLKYIKTLRNSFIRKTGWAIMKMSVSEMFHKTK